MCSFKIYPQSPKEIDVQKIYWAFWQSSYSYNINNDFVCLFSCNTKAVDENGTTINTLGYMNFVYKAFGTFYLCELPTHGRADGLGFRSRHSH